jgi:hypothetical protein
MLFDKPIRRVAVVSTGAIGASVRSPTRGPRRFYTISWKRTKCSSPQVLAVLRVKGSAPLSRDVAEPRTQRGTSPKRCAVSWTRSRSG